MEVDDDFVLEEEEDEFKPQTKKKKSVKANIQFSGKREGIKVPWVEKYRPKTVDDVAHQDEVVATLKKSLETGNLPHLLFYGPPGTGKTSTILAIARDLYGHDELKNRVMELNASDERGISVIRNKVKNFAQTTTAAGLKDGRALPPYKLIILDECDSLTGDAQAALRRIMENYSRVTRFCLICNYVSRIIDPLASRCAKFRFKPLEGDVMVNKLNSICKEENLSITPEGLRAVIDISKGDLRKAITTLQSLNALVDKKELTKEDVIDISGVVPENRVADLLGACKSKSFLRMQAAASNLMLEGYAADQIIGEMHNFVVKDTGMTSKQKAQIALKLSEVDSRLIDGADEFLQLLDLASFITNVFIENQ